MSPILILFFLNYFAESFGVFYQNHVADVFGVLYQTPRRRFHFDDDLGHGNHSGELLLFVGCIINFAVSYLICMFQDSVPAGSYNDPFLSSVCEMVCKRFSALFVTMPLWEILF